jgi:hypothetical protein
MLWWLAHFGMIVLGDRLLFFFFSTYVFDSFHFLGFKKIYINFTGQTYNANPTLWAKSLRTNLARNLEENESICSRICMI